MARYLYSELASLIQARRNCDNCTCSTENCSHGEWFDKHTDRIESLVKEHMPSGSGFDSGTSLNMDASHGEKLVFATAFHYMDESGMYDGWTEHTVTVTPSFSGFNLRVSGRNRNDIKEYIGETFHQALMIDVEHVRNAAEGGK